MKCETAQECISEYYDNQLDKKQWRKLKEHLGTCSDCLKLFKKMNKLQEKMSQFTVPARKEQKIQLPARQKSLRKRALIYGFSAAGSLAVGLIALIIVAQVYTPMGTKPLNSPSRSYGRRAGEAPTATQKTSKDAPSNYSEDSVGTAQAKDENKKNDSSLKNLLLAQSVSISLKVDSITKTVKLITEVTENNDGYVSSTNLGGGYKTYMPDTGSGYQSESVTPYPTSLPTVTLKVPAKNLKATKKAIRKIGVVLSESVNNEDVTLTVIDLEAKIRNYKRQENRYLKLIDRAATIADLQSLESSLAGIRSTIEETEAQLKYQRSRVAMATINVSLTKKNLGNTSSSSNWFMKSLNLGIDAFAGVSSVLMTLFFGLAPFILLGLLVYAVIRIRRRLR